MFLVNMSRDEKGASALMQEGEEVEGLHVRRLLNWFTQPSSSTSSAAAAAAASASPAAKAQQQPVMDPNAYCAHILTNVSQIAPGRRLLMHAERGYLAQLKPQLLSSNSIRRMGSFQLLKNCFIEESHHGALLEQGLGLMPLILRPILGPEPFLHGESEYAGIDPRVRDQLTPDKRRDADPHLRVIVYEILLLCAKVKPSRILLKSQAIYPILRHAHDAEKADSDPAALELDDLLEQLVPFFILDEDDALHPDQIEAEKRRARVDQLKAINDLEQDKQRHPNETPEQRKQRIKTEAEAADKSVHYLGDELGGEVRRREEMDKRAAAAAAAAAASPAAVAAARASASSVAPPKPGSATLELIDDTFPDIEPLGAAESQSQKHFAHTHARARCPTPAPASFCPRRNHQPPCRNVSQARPHLHSPPSSGECDTNELRWLFVSLTLPLRVCGLCFCVCVRSALQLGEVSHNIQSLETAKAALHVAPAAAKPEVVYAQPSSDWKDDDDQDEDEEDVPPPLADEEDRYMNGLD